MSSEDFIAHIRTSDGAEQRLVDHLKEVQALAEEIGQKIGLPHVTGLAGMLHDMGKFSQAFQGYIREAAANPANPPKRGSVDHSTAGGKFLLKHFHLGGTVAFILTESVANAIFTHHGQLIDMVDIEGQSPFVKRWEVEKDISFLQVEQHFLQYMYDLDYMHAYVQKAVSELQIFFENRLKNVKTASEATSIMQKLTSYLTMYVFSALIDADRRNSCDFEKNEENLHYDSQVLWSAFEQRLNIELAEKQRSALPNAITRLREQMSKTCLEKATLSTGIYTLSMPTGGGKTLASLRFALRHAQLHQKKRIIFIVPFTTIIEQNAQEVRDVLQAEDFVLEHHSNVIEESEPREDLSFEEYQTARKLNAAKDDWDIPIVFTTMVQFLETFYSGRSRSIRRLHNLANSILIFDEIQAVPIHCVSLFNEALNFLKNTCQTTSILCTATQPSLQYVRHNIKLDGELMENLPSIVEAFQRTTIKPLLKDKGWSTEELYGFIEERLKTSNNILVILNTKRAVKDLFEQFHNGDIEVVHLSTGMCPAHRKQKLKDMREKLRKKEKFLCISTQLIEAGVDISFDCVIRSLSGLDSIAQAAGRCNRHGEVPLRDVYVINHAEESLNKLPTIKKGGECASYIMKDLQHNPTLFGGNLLSTASMTHYFKNFYQLFESKLNYPIPALQTTIYELLFRVDTDWNKDYLKGQGRQNPLAILASFRTAFSHFEVIDAKTQGILVPYGEGEELITQLTSREPITDYPLFLKKAQQYSVNVFKHEFEALKQNNQLIVVHFGSLTIYAAKDAAYDEQYGISTQGEAHLTDFIV
ncbi:CRISPR-associated helicase Cas3' [Lysinibacillus sp. FSL K6-0075]|uniref:CRISPR-associated helicase Cas3' n=1 Tax=Lysinibacillus sp. FSL K6-0075 TaxID=2921415 RepID=UPI00315814EC